MDFETLLKNRRSIRDMTSKMIIRPILIIALLVSLFACRDGNQHPPLSQVSIVNLSRYLGLWYEIATIDHSFQKDCVASTADYSLKPDGYIKVVNTCRKRRLGYRQPCLLVHNVRTDQDLYGSMLRSSRLPSKSLQG